MDSDGAKLQAGVGPGWPRLCSHAHTQRAIASVWRIRRGDSGAGANMRGSGVGVPQSGGAAVPPPPANMSDVPLSTSLPLNESDAAETFNIGF